MPNRVAIDKNGLIVTIFDGPQTYENVSRVADETEELTKKLRAEDQPVLILDDLSRIGVQTADSRKAAREALERLDYDKVALFGGNIFLKHVTNLIIKVTGKADKVRYLDDQKKAEEWLKQK